MSSLLIPTKQQFGWKVSGKPMFSSAQIQLKEECANKSEEGEKKYKIAIGPIFQMVGW